MRFAFTSDLHGQLPSPYEIPECDALVVAGDICPDYFVAGDRGRKAAAQAEWLDQKLSPYLQRLLDSHVGRVIGVWGNHDFVGERRALWEPLELPIRFLNHEMIDVDGVNVYGSPHVPGLPRWAFHASEEALAVRAKNIPAEADLIVVHGPPYGTADFVAPQFGSLCVGDRALARALDSGKHDGALFVCGHIHEQYGKHQTVEGLDVWNVSYVDENYVAGNPPMLWEVRT